MISTGNLFYIGQINLLSIRNFVIDNSLTEADTIKLHQMNFDDIVLEYKREYGQSLTLPFLCLTHSLKKTRQAKFLLTGYG